MKSGVGGGGGGGGAPVVNAPEVSAPPTRPQLDGRAFPDHVVALTWDDGPGAPSVVIVNQSLARTLWPKQDPLGRRLKTISDERKLGWRTVDPAEVEGRFDDRRGPEPRRAWR